MVQIESDSFGNVRLIAPIEINEGETSNAILTEHERVGGSERMYECSDANMSLVFLTLQNRKPFSYTKSRLLYLCVSSSPYIYLKNHSIIITRNVTNLFQLRENNKEYIYS